MMKHVFALGLPALRVEVQRAQRTFADRRQRLGFPLKVSFDRLRWLKAGIAIRPGIAVTNMNGPNLTTRFCAGLIRRILTRKEAEDSALNIHQSDSQTTWLAQPSTQWFELDSSFSRLLR